MVAFPLTLVGYRALMADGDMYLGADGVVASASTRTFTAKNLGPVDERRTICVLVETQGGTACKHASVTIGGVAAGKKSEGVNTASTLMNSFWTAHVPNGNTGDIVVNVDDGAGLPVNTGRFVIHWWSTYRGPDPVGTFSDSSAPLSQAGFVGEDGMALVASQSSSATAVSNDFTLVNEDFDNNQIGAGNLWSAAGRAYAEGSLTFNSTWSGGTPQRMVGAIFGPPMLNVAAVRARSISDAITLQFRFNIAATDGPTYFWATNDGLQNGTVNSTGWVQALYKPLADVGVKAIRSSVGNATTNLMATLIIKYIRDNIATGFLDVNLVAQTFDSPSVQTIIDRIHTEYPTAVRAFMGLNEPNNPDIVANPNYPDWINNVIDHTIATSAQIRGYVDWDAIPLLSFSLFERSAADISRLIGYTAHPGGKTWLKDCLPLVAYGNLHAYNGGRNVTILGNTADNAGVGGVPAEVTLSEVLLDYARAFGNKQIWASEFGFEVKEPSDAARRMTKNAAAKYYMRWTLEALKLGIPRATWFEFFKTDPDNDFAMVEHVINTGVISFTPRKAYTMLLNYATMIFDNGVTANSFTPGNLYFNLSSDSSAPGGMSTAIHYYVAQKSDGKKLLHLWYDYPSWDRNNRVEDFQSKTVRLTLHKPQVLRIGQPYAANTWTSVNGGAPTASVVLTVPDDLLIVEIT